MGLWDWSQAAYAQPGVAEACLRLQDAHGQNISFLLWSVWSETDDRALLARGAELARRWEALALLPLRGVRRALKAEADGVPDVAREALRQDIKAAELRAERVLLESLEALGARTHAGAPPLQVLTAASAAWNPVAPDAALAALAAAFG